MFRLYLRISNCIKLLLTCLALIAIITFQNSISLTNNKVMEDFNINLEAKMEKRYFSDRRSNGILLLYM